MFKNLKKFLFTAGSIFTMALILASCQQTALLSTITIGPSNVSTVAGEDTSLVVVFSDFTTVPNSVDIYAEGQEEAVATEVAVTDNAMVLPTAALEEGAYRYCVKSGEIESNYVTVSIVAKETAAQKIVISPSVKATEGDSLSLVIAFCNYETDPETVDIYVDGKNEAFKKDVAVSNNTISVTSEGLTGSVNIYAKAGDTASNKCAVTLNKKVEVKKPSITLEGPAKVSLTGKTNCTFYAKYTINDFASFDFNTKPKINVYVDNKLRNTIEPDKETDTTYYYLYNDSKGKHQMYLALADSELKSNTLEFELVESAIEPTLSVKKTKINTVTLTCDSTGASNYHFYRNTTNDLATAYYMGWTNNTYQPSYDYPIPDATETGKLYFWVRASNSTTNTISDGLTSKPVEYEYTKETTISAAPTGVTVTKQQGVRNGINVKWTEDPVVPKYYVYYTTSEDPSSDKTYLRTNPYNKNGFDVSLTDLETGTYYIWVRPYIYNYYSENNPASKVAYKFTYEKPAAPSKVAVTAGPSSNKNSVTVSWAWDDATYHTIYYSGINDSSTAKLATTTAISDKASYDIKLPGTGDYYIWVKAADDSASNTSKVSDFSTSVKYTLASYESSYAVPANVTVTNASDTQIKISCDTVTGASYYWFYFSQTDNPRNLTMQNYSGSPYKTYNKSDFEADKEYYFWVKAAAYINENGSETSDFSTVVKFTPNPAN